MFRLFLTKSLEPSVPHYFDLLIEILLLPRFNRLLPVVSLCSQF